MKSLMFFLLVFSCAGSLWLSAQETYLWTPISDTMSICSESYCHYEMHEFDFLTADNNKLLFSIDADRFTNPGMTGNHNEISCFEFTDDRTLVYFMESEGDLYRYTLATDDLEHLGDVTPETTPVVLVHDYNLITDIFFISDSILYCSGSAYGEYNINTNEFRKIRSPDDFLDSWSIPEQDITSNSVARHKDAYIYVSATLSVSVSIMDLENPENNENLFSYYGTSYSFLDRPVVSYQFECDSSNYYILGSIQGQSMSLGWYKIDMTTGVPSYSHDYLNIPGSRLSNLSIRHYNDRDWADCQRLVDLDEGDYTVSGVDVLVDSLCSSDLSPIPDLAVKINNEFRIDSVEVQIDGNLSGVRLSIDASVLSGLDLTGYEKASGYTLINARGVSHSDMEEALENLNLTAPSSQNTFRLTFSVWYDGVPGPRATADIYITSPLPLAGEDVSFTFCEDEVVPVLEELTSSSADKGGRFLDGSYVELNALPVYQGYSEDTIYYVTTNGICHDTASVMITTNPLPDVVMLTDYTICPGSTQSIDLSSYAEDIIWQDGSTDKIRTLDEAGVYTYQIINAAGCLGSDSFAITKTPSPEMRPIEAKVCAGEQFEFMNVRYSEEGSYMDTLLGREGCDSIIYDLELKLYERSSIVVDGKFGYCADETTIIDVMSNHTDLLLDGVMVTTELIFDEVGDFLLTGYNENGCLDSLSMSIRAFSSPDLVPQQDYFLCHGESHQVDLSPYSESVMWYDGETDKVREFANEGSYTYEMSTVDGCIRRDTFSIAVSAVPVKESVTRQVCAGEMFAFMGITYAEEGGHLDTLLSSEGCDSIHYRIELQFYEDDPLEVVGDLGFCEGETTMLTIKSDHTDLLLDGVVFTEDFVIDEVMDIQLTGYDVHGCLDTLEFSTEQYEVPTVTVQNLINLVFGPELEMPVSYEGNIVGYNWSPGHPLSCEDCPYPELLEPVSGIYRIEVVNEEGCTAMDSLTVSFVENKTYVPNMINLNSDLVENSVFYLQGSSSLTYGLKVYDRWGNLIFNNPSARINNVEDGWQPESELESGVYVYKLEYNDNGLLESLTGSVTLIK